ncbi:hypothetical protein WJ87_05280 [Burkholderia ubonensis]|nr:hypothetical protein WJ87_05280 [Burkholderia ubonensis]
MDQLIQGKIMSQAIAPTSVKWPSLQFAPINLWSFPAAWKRDPAEFRPAPALATQDSASHHQVNPLIRRILSHR